MATKLPSSTATRSLLPGPTPRTGKLSSSTASAVAANTKERWHVKHVELPVDLRDAGVMDEETRKSLWAVFPGTTMVLETGRPRAYLLFETLDLPKAPWPKTIGGLPFTLTTTKNAGHTFLFPMKQRGNPRLSILPSEGPSTNPRSVSEADLHQLAQKIVSYFNSEAPDISVQEIMSTFDGCLYIFLSDATDIRKNRSRLPGKIGNIPTMFCHISSIRSPSSLKPKSQQVVCATPEGQVVDGTAYDILRPGMLIGSHKVDTSGNVGTLLSCSGVLVKDIHGNTSMTASTRAMGTSGQVFSPSSCPGPRCIGVSGGYLPGTDIAFIELDDSVQFENEPFDCGDDVCTKLTRLARPQETLAYDACYMNTPYTGLLEGQVVALSVPVEGLSLPHLAYQWCFLGQDPATGRDIAPPDSVCGSVVWNDEGVVQGFYRFFIESGGFAGLSASVCASCLHESGYELDV